METHEKINNFEVAMEWKQIRTGLIETYSTKDGK
jgi:hypothetical protein